MAGGDQSGKGGSEDGKPGARTAPAAGPARVGAPPAGIEAGGTGPGATGPAGAPKSVSQLGQDQNPDSLGHEGMQSTVKQNTTDQGKFQDRD